MRVVVVDLGLGNLHSVEHALRRAGAEPRVVSDPDQLRGAARLVVPGQGGFGEGAARLRDGFGDALRAELERGTPYFGICLGMQLLFEASEEASGAGLGWLTGSVRRFAASPERKVPHMGWSLVDGVVDGWFYFAHSYYCVPGDPGVVAATAEYGQPFAAAVKRGSLFACQFHPEKSHLRGARLLAAFVRGEGPWS